MSRILRRPMFRGGPVDSRGTGITSGLMDGGRVGLANGGDFKLGGDLYTKDDFSKFIDSYKPNMSNALINNLFDRKTGELKPNMTYENIFQATEENEDGKEIPKSVFDADIFDFSNVGIKGDKSGRIGATSIGKDDFADALKTDVLSKLEDSKAYEPEFRGGGADAAQADFGKEKLDVDNSDTTGNNTSNTEISAKDLIRENAELFKELLNEGNKDKIKKARIQDMSDLGLDIFAQSQKEGATVGSTLGGAAEKLVGKDTRVDKAKASIEKGDQTAVALAINDYIAGKRSKEATNQLIARLTFGEQLKKGSLGQAFADFRAKQGTLGTTDMEIIIKGRFPGRQTEIIAAGAGEYQPSPDGSDEGKFYIEEDTKDVYEVVNGKKVKRF